MRRGEYPFDGEMILNTNKNKNRKCEDFKNGGCSAWWRLQCAYFGIFHSVLLTVFT